MRVPILLLKAFAFAAAMFALAACQPPNPATPALPAGESTAQTENTGGGARTEDAPQVAATVNGEPITLAEFEQELIRFEAAQAAMGSDVANQSGYQQQVLDKMIEDELVRQRAADQGVSVSPEEVDAEINDMIAETGEEYFTSWLNLNLYTEEEFREYIRQDLLFRRLIQPVIDSVPESAEHVRARHILVNSREDATAVLTRLENGEDFGELAAQFSVDVTTRDNGGDLGWFPRGGLTVPQVEEAAFSLETGQRSGIIESAWGFHIVEKLEVDPNRTIGQETRNRIISRTVEEWRRDLRESASVEQIIDLPI